MKKRIFNSEVIFGAVAILVSVYFIVAGQAFPGATKNGVPGSGYFPTIAAGGVILCSSSRASASPPPISSWTRPRSRT